jgi:hypothetical protein
MSTLNKGLGREILSVCIVCTRCDLPLDLETRLDSPP